jgi:RNA polymerase sigma factor (sigma-70 family)
MKADNQKSSNCTAESDLELLRRFKKGDERAFVALLDGHMGYLRHWVRLVLEKASWANPDDLLQEARIGLYEAAEKFDLSRKGNFHAWARKSCMGRMFDSREVQLVKETPYKKHRKVVKAHDRLMKELNRNPTLEELSDETNLSVKQVETALDLITPFKLSLDEAKGKLTFEDPYELQLISDAFNQISPDYAEVLILHHLLEQTYRQIAKAMGRSEDAIKKLHQRARKQLKDIIYGEGDRKDGT